MQNLPFVEHAKRGRGESYPLFETAGKRENKPMWENDNEEREGALDALEKAMLPATLAEREGCPTCGK
jgi:hypothetical protein